MPPKLFKVVRLDSIPLESTHFTPEGYLIDSPIVTSVGIFEYNNPDGTVRRELRLPEEVFAEESLASYQGKPVIITHDAVYVSKDNVQDENIGTILSKGYRDGDDVRAKIVIHNTDAMKECGLRELSLGYNLDIEETPGEWNGQRYDAIQRNIRVNHLALVQEARAGDQARLNIDSRDKKILKGGKCMKGTKKGAVKAAGRNDGVLSPEELDKSIEAYKKRRDNRLAAKADEGEPTPDNASIVPKTKPVSGENTDSDPTAEGEVKGAAKSDTEEPVDLSNPEEAAQIIKDRRDRRDEQGDPKSIKEANGVIAKQDEDIDNLFDIIDSLLAERDFNAAAKSDSDDETPSADVPIVKGNETDGDDGPNKPIPAGDGDDTCLNDDEEENPVAPAKSESIKAMNSDSIDAVSRQRIKVERIGHELGIDCLEDMNIVKAKKTVIKAVVPDMRLDGKSIAYIDGVFDAVAKAIKKKSAKDTSYQKRQMFNTDGRGSMGAALTNSARSARERMIARHHNSNKEVK